MTDRAFRIARKGASWCTNSSAVARWRRRRDALIESKKGLSDEPLAGGDEINLTEMTNDDIMRMVSLDLRRTMKE